MGLDFTHTDARWSYGGFHRFRTRLFEETSNGLKLDKMEGFNHDWFGESQEPGISFDNYDHPLRDLIDHSDCEDELTPEQMSVIEPALRELVQKWEDCYDKQQALSLCDGMREAMANNESMGFH